jgi:hypothetical protein
MDMSTVNDTPGHAAANAALMEQILSEAKKVVVGKYRFLECALGLLLLQDAESGEQLLDTADKQFRRRFAEEVARRDEGVMKAIADAGMDVLELSPGDELVEAILRYVDLWKTRLRLGRGRAMPAHLISAP